MADAALFDSSVSGEYAQLTFSARPQIYLGFQIYMTAAQLAANVNFGEGMDLGSTSSHDENLLTSDVGEVFGNGDYYAPPGSITADTWHTLEMLWQPTASPAQVALDGTIGVDNYGPFAGVDVTDVFVGGIVGSGTPNEGCYIGRVWVGTDAGLHDILEENWASGDFSNWTFSNGSVVTAPSPPPVFTPALGPTPPPPSPTGVAGVYVAFGSPTLSETPDYQPLVAVQGWNSDRGRQYELDKTQAGTAVVTIIDQDGTYDFSNPASPWFGMIGPLAPAQIRSVNPVSKVTEPVFTGFVESWDYVLDITERWYILTLNLSDAFEPLARAETVPDSTGTTILDADLVDDRITGVLADFGWPADKELIFSGNVHLQRTVYNPQTSLLSVLQDCADAELPNAANIFVDKWGQVAFRGRFSRLIPQDYGPRIGGMTPPAGHQAINFWEVGDRQAAETFGIAPIASLEWTLDLKNIINAVVATPNGIGQAQIQNQLVDNATSIAQYGTRVLSISDLLTLDQVSDPTQGQLALDANDACKIFGQYFVDNYSFPVEMISAISFKTRDPSDPLGGPLWDFICGVEIGDVLKVWSTNPGGGGFRETQFFVEGIHNVVKPLEGGVLDWTMTLDLSPRAWYSTFNGRTYYVPPTYPPGAPAAAFNATPAIGSGPLDVSFIDQSIPGPSGPITGWAWDFGDTHTSTSQNPTHTFAAGPPYYTVTLTVTGTGSDGTASKSQTVIAT